MDKQTALKRVASILALDSYNHIVAAREYNHLQENTDQAIKHNEQAADALDVLLMYRARLLNLTH